MIDFPHILPFIENRETVAAWKKEFEEFNERAKNPSISRLKQSIEIDAIGYAHYWMAVLFGVKTLIPDEIKEDINSIIVKFQQASLK
jgi:hypothetical protein